MRADAQRAILAALADAALIVDRRWQVVTANAPAEALLGAALPGAALLTRIRHPAAVAALGQALAGTQPEPAEARLVLRGRSVLARISVAPLQDGALVVLRDLSETQAAHALRSDFVANASHELKTPLTTIAGLVETLQGPAQADPAAQARFLDMIAEQAQRMTRLIDDLLSLNRIEADERVPPRRPVDLSALAASVLDELAPLAEARKARLEREIEPGITVPGDSEQLAQALRNLVENALRYGGEPPEITVRLARTPPDPEGRGVALTVADRGPGIAARHIPRLTERFYRVDAHRSRAAGGTGLGLAIVKHVTARHRGRLLIDSAPGQGSRFTLRLAEASAEGNGSGG